MWVLIVFSSNKVAPSVYDVLTSENQVIDCLLQLKLLKTEQIARELKEYPTDNASAYLSADSEEQDEQEIEDEGGPYYLDLRFWAKCYEIKDTTPFIQKGVDEHLEIGWRKPYLLVVKKENFTISQIIDKLEVF